MKKISKNLYSACEYAKANEGKKSLTQIATNFGVDRHSISKHLTDYQNYSFIKEDFCYYLSEEELEPVKFFIDNPNTSLAAVARQFNTKADTIKRRMEVIGEQYQTRYKRKFNRDIFHTLDSVEKAYWLGFILADGYINEERGFLKIKLAEKDREHLIKFSKFMGEENPPIQEETGGAYTKDNKCVSIEYDSRELVNDLVQNYNLRNNKSGKEEPITIQVSEDIDINNNFIFAYIRGMIDGDGHVEDGYFKYVGSLTSCEYLKNIFKQWYSFKEDHKYIYEHGTIYSFEIRSKKVNDILKKIYNNSTIYLDRKYQTVQNFN